MRDFTGKVAVVTGGAEGIGRAIAERAAAAGMKLVLADIDRARLDAALADFAGRGIEAIGLETDVSKADQVDALAALAFERFGNVHLLVNNAGVAHNRPVWETTQADWDWVMGVNLYGVINGLRSFIPTMLKHGEEGHIVNTASMAGLLSQPGLAIYNASKHAVVTVSEGLHHDLTLRQSKLRVSVLCPAWVKTRIHQSERNRPAGPGTSPFDGLDPVASKVGHAIMNAVENGIPVEDVANCVFDAIAAQRFYILTHPAYKDAIKVRMEDILEDRPPTLRAAL
ncbi:MAG TPA: SDR family NAD(P)-dependent oxidoreductase [Aliidongia sp.]|uniref:SDR family NAD(P)-dependent oxidoreductase n=1 Tax=Aliidongia sp. TaxID=1914230 RepID=UPI002DDD6122|nr:SDR family NAD(P)-dependent oxidoreductase [Aliidongia sp.]HEV2673719.1 SDR family NAD(P)-dependent oxidoreductase [Aliidongia sp.]